MRERIEACQHRVALALQDKAVVGRQLGTQVELVGINTCRVRINTVDQFRINTLIRFLRALEDIHVCHLVGDVIFYLNTQ